MNKTKIQKGITLIALIITIIILLILAVVTIGSIKNSNIITYAQNAASDYEQAKGKEEGLLSDYEDKIKEYLNNDTSITWKDNGNGTFTSTTGVTVSIGDYVEYNPGSYSYQFENETADKKVGIGTDFTGNAVEGNIMLESEKITTEETLKWRVFRNQ